MHPANNTPHLRGVLFRYTCYNNYRDKGLPNLNTNRNEEFKMKLAMITYQQAFLMENVEEMHEEVKRIEDAFDGWGVFNETRSEHFDLQPVVEYALDSMSEVLILPESNTAFYNQLMKFVERGAIKLLPVYAVANAVQFLENELIENENSQYYSQIEELREILVAEETSEEYVKFSPKEIEIGLPLVRIAQKTAYSEEDKYLVERGHVDRVIYSMLKQVYSQHGIHFEEDRFVLLIKILSDTVRQEEK